MGSEYVCPAELELSTVLPGSFNHDHLLHHICSHHDHRGHHGFVLGKKVYKSGCHTEEGGQQQNSTTELTGGWETARANSGVFQSKVRLKI